jgi:hypothetical protein
MAFLKVSIAPAGFELAVVDRDTDAVLGQWPIGEVYKMMQNIESLIENECRKYAEMMETLDDVKRLHKTNAAAEMWCRDHLKKIKLRLHVLWCIQDNKEDIRYMQKTLV